MHETWTRIGDLNCGVMLTGSAIGANHAEKGLPCQDSSVAAIQYYKGHPYVLLVVADGHGASRYTRSELGAYFAVQAAAEAASRWVLFAAECLEQHPELWLINVRNEFGPRFVNMLRQTWERKVDEHLVACPLPDSDSAPQSAHTAYGTTVALALIFQGQVFAGAIGDSTVLIVTNEEDAQDVLAGDKTETLGLSTHSLAQENAALKWKHRVLPLDEVRMLCAVTDGFTDSLADVPHTLVTLNRDARSKGFAWLESKLPKFLERLTNQGVGDDIATVFYFPPESQSSTMTQNSGVEHE